MFTESLDPDSFAVVLDHFSCFTPAILPVLAVTLVIAHLVPEYGIDFAVILDDVEANSPVGFEGAHRVERKLFSRFVANFPWCIALNPVSLRGPADGKAAAIRLDNDLHTSTRLWFFD